LLPASAPALLLVAGFAAHPTLKAAAATEHWADEKLVSKLDAAAKGVARDEGVYRGKSTQPAAALQAVTANHDAQAATINP